MKDVQKFRNLIEFLASEHPLVRHTKDCVHFASTLDAADNAYARTMHYPCIALDMGDMQIEQVPLINRRVLLAVMHHVKDTGSTVEKDRAFDLCSDIAIDVLSQLVRIAENHPEQKFLSRIDLNGAELVRVELEESGLYGWIVQMFHSFSLSSAACDGGYGEDFDQKVDEYFSR